MASGKKKLNGSVDLLAKSMRDVFSEAMEAVHGAVKKDMDAMEGRLNERIDGVERRIDTTNENMQAQFAEQEKKIGRLLGSKSARRRSRWRPSWQHSHLSSLASWNGCETAADRTAPADNRATRLRSCP